NRIGIAMAGWSVLWLVRPWEALCLAFPVAVYLLVRRRNPIRPALYLLPVAALTALHNYSVTGNAALLPYQLLQQQFGVPQNVIFFPPRPEPPQTLEVHHQSDQWQLGLYTQLRSHMLSGF